MTEEPTHNKEPQETNKVLSTQPAFIWPEARWHTKDGTYECHPPFDSFLVDADLINGVIVGTWNGTVDWVHTLMQKGGARRVVLVLIVYPVCPTREEHLRRLLHLQGQIAGDDKKLSLRLLPVDLAYGKDFERMVLPPTVFQARDSKSGKTMFCVGSVGDCGRDKAELGSFNMVFEPDDGLRNEWRKWFQFIFSSASPLTSETAQIPHLIPAEGDPAAAEMWTAFSEICLGSDEDEVAQPKVDPETGEILEEPDGTAVQPWDANKTKLDPLAQEFQQVYSNGYLVTVDETTRIKPLAIPVKATLLGQKAERAVGDVTHRQSFSLQVLDEAIAKEVEKCRRVTDIMDLLTYQLSKGNRWIPEAAKILMDNELNARSTKGKDILKEALSTDAKAFVEKRQKNIHESLNKMYSELGRGETVPSDMLSEVLSNVQDRLTAALNARLTPRAMYNKIAPPDLTASAPDENWAQPFSLLLRSARLMREALTDTYFPRRFKGLSLTEEDFRAAMNIFDDAIIKTPDLQRARTELSDLEKIEKGSEGPKGKCIAVLRIITGEILK